VLIVTAIVAAVQILLMRRRKPDQPKWPYCCASIVAAIIMLGFAEPVFVALASILITGRTM